MKLAWSRPELSTVCRSELALRAAWPQHADDVMVMLTMISSAPTLGCLSQLRSLRLDIQPAAKPGRAPAFVVQYNEIQMRGILVNPQGNPLIMHAVATAPYWEHVDCIRIDTVTTVSEGSRRRAGS